VAENNPHMPDLVGSGIKIIRFAVRATVAGQAHLNYFFYSTSLNLTSSSDIRNAILDFWGHVSASWVAAVCDSFIVQNIVARRVDLYAAPSYFKTGADLVAAGNAIQGTAAGDSLPPQDAVCLKKLTVSGGKRGRGRWYLSGIAEGDQDAGQLTGPAGAAFLALAADLEDTFVGAATTSTLSPYHVYWREFPPPLLSPVEGSPILQVLPDSIVRSQRRRQVGVGI